MRDYFDSDFTVADGSVNDYVSVSLHSYTLVGSVYTVSGSVYTLVGCVYTLVRSVKHFGFLVYCILVMITHL